jgi:hypothetical protein
MPIDLSIPQAVLLSDSSGVRLAARSGDFPDSWEEVAVRFVNGFGPRPEGVAVPSALAVLPFDKNHTAVIQLADDGTALAFRLLVLNRKLFEAISDPFAVGDKFPPNWFARGSLPSLNWTPDPTPLRTVAEVAEILHHDGPLLLGATQAVLDGFTLVIRRPAPDADVVRRVWKLLPYSKQRELAVATFTFGHDPRFQLSVSPNPPDKLPPGTLDEERCRDVPQGRYELALQLAAESGNQAELDRLFARRSSTATLRMAIILAVLMMLTLVATKLFW